MVERKPTLAALFDALERCDRARDDCLVVLTFAECATQHGGTGDMLVECETVLHWTMHGERDVQIGEFSIDPSSIFSCNFELARRQMSMEDLQWALRTRAQYRELIAVAEHGARTASDGGATPRFRSIGIATLNDLADRARHGIAELDAALFTALTGISVHVIAGIIAEPFTPAELYEAGFPKPLPPPQHVAAGATGTA